MKRALRALAGLGLALWASGAAAGDYEWPVVEVIDGATLVVDAGADFPPELAMLTVRLRGVGTEDAAALSAALAATSKVVFRNPRYGGRDCGRGGRRKGAVAIAAGRSSKTALRARGAAAAGAARIVRGPARHPPHPSV